MRVTLGHWQAALRWNTHGAQQEEMPASQANLPVLSFPEHQMNCRRKTPKKRMETKCEERGDERQQRKVGGPGWVERSQRTSRGQKVAGDGVTSE